MINVLIVDDEYQIREGINNSIPWEQLNLHSVGTAISGTDAWNKVKTIRTNIVVLDINMPDMDGLELAQRLREENKNLQFIFLTGYDDFPKVKKAIELGASDYLLKPVSYGELCKSLEKAAESVRENESSKKYIEALEGKILKSAEITADKIWTELLHRQRNYVDCLKGLKEIGIEFQMNHSYSVIAIAIDHYNSLLQKWDVQDCKLNSYALSKLAKEVISLFANGVVIKGQPGYITLIVTSDFEPEDSRSKNIFIQLVKEFQQKSLEYLELSISIGVSKMHDSPDDTHKAYQEAMQALEYKSVLGAKSIIYFGLIEPKAAVFKQVLNKELYLLSELRLGNEAAVDNILNNMIKELQGRSLSDGKIISTQLMIYAIRMISENDLEKVFVEDPFSSIYNAETISDVLVVMTSFFHHVIQSIKKHNRLGNPNVIEDAKQWIRDHISEDISLNKLANYVHMSPNYLSALFKQATGETFIEFSTRTRFELAKQLLIQPEIKIYQIAEKIGYTDANYFSIAFKKNEGMTPSQYRARYI